MNITRKKIAHALKINASGPGVHEVSFIQKSSESSISNSRPLHQKFLTLHFHHMKNLKIYPISELKLTKQKNTLSKLPEFFLF